MMTHSHVKLKQNHLNLIVRLATSLKPMYVLHVLIFLDDRFTMIIILVHLLLLASDSKHKRYKRV